MAVSVDKLVKAYTKIRDKRSELSSKYKEEEGKLREQQDKVKQKQLPLLLLKKWMNIALKRLKK